MYIPLYCVCERVCVHPMFRLFVNMYFACIVCMCVLLRHMIVWPEPSPVKFSSVLFCSDSAQTGKMWGC